MRRAYLVHSYRDEQGVPRHKTLAYLGAEGELTPERVDELREKHKDLAIHWERIAPAAKPPRSLDAATLSDEALLCNLKLLRREKGLNIQAMVQALTQAGLPPFKIPGFGDHVVSPEYYKRFERRVVENKAAQYSFLLPHILPFLRKVFES